MPKQLGRMAAILVGVLLAIAAPAAAGTVWTPVGSGTTQDITAIDYQSDAAAWYATSNGQIFFASPGGGFAMGANLPGNSFSDIAFGPGGSVGYAVALNGHAFRSTNGGQTWTPVTLPAVNSNCTFVTSVPVPRLYGIVWADANTAFLVGGSDTSEPVVLRSANAAAATPTFADANFTGSDCRASSGGSYITDGFAVPGNPLALAFITENFGAVWTSSDGFASPLVHSGDMINNFANAPRMTFDPNNPNRIWAVDHGGSLCGDLCFQYSEVGGGSDNAMTIAGSPSGLSENLYDVGFAGGTLVAAGDAGEIYTSLDGRTAYLQPADGSFATTAWRSVGVADGTHAMVGGAGGALVKTTNANAIPVPAPPAGGPPPVVHPLPLPSTLTVGANPTTKRTAGATITLYKTIHVSKGRYVPVKLSTRVPRNFVIEILTPRRPYHHVATLKTSLRRGAKTVHVKLPKHLKNGRYLIVVRVFKGRHGLGRSIRQAFIVTA
jgi:hypothetical protein